MARGRPRIHAMKPEASDAISGLVIHFVSVAALDGASQIHVHVQARNTQEGGAGCESACRAHSHVFHTGEEAHLSGQTACHLIVIEVPARGEGRAKQVGLLSVCLPHLTLRL